MAKRIYSDEQITEALARESNCTLTAVCAEVGCSSWTLHDRISRSPELRRLADELSERGREDREREKEKRKLAQLRAIEVPDQIICEIVANWAGWSFQETRGALAKLSKAVKKANQAKRALGIAPRRLTYRRTC